MHYLLPCPAPALKHDQVLISASLKCTHLFNASKQTIAPASILPDYSILHPYLTFGLSYDPPCSVPDFSPFHRFPPHSGPIPREMATNNPRDSQRSSTPPLSLRNDVSPASFSSAEQRPRHIKYASIDPSFRKTSALPRTHARRRTERDQPHALLTPPLTPSSSIRTTASRDSASSTGIQGHDPDDVAFKEEICDADPDSTRFLLVGAAKSVQLQFDLFFLIFRLAM